MSSKTVSGNKLINSTLENLEKQRNSGRFWNISWKLGEYLEDLVLKYSPKCVLEIGTSNGFSTLWIAKGLGEGSKMITVEVDETRFKLAKKNFETSNANNIIQIQGEIFEILENKTFNEKFDFIFLDAAHKKYKEVIEELEKKNLLEKNCVIVCDNVISHSYMSNFVNWMATKYKTEVYEIDSGFLVATSNSIK